MKRPLGRDLVELKSLEPSPHCELLRAKNRWGGFTRGKAHVVEVRYEPKQVQLTLDGQLTLDLRGDFPPGRVGFYLYSLSKARFYDVEITPTPKP